MDRLTAQYGKNHAVPTKFDLDFVFRIDSDVWNGLMNIFDRLAAYEDTSLEPEEVAELKKALELACEDAADEQCPHEFDLYTCNKCADCPHNGEIHTDAERDAQCWYDYYVHQAQEQEGKK